MKKFLSLALVGLCAFAFVGCGNKSKKAEKTINDSIIELRDNIYVGSDDNFYTTFCSGVREEPYALDGKVNSSIDYGIITLSKNDNSKLSEDEYLFTIIVNGESLGGKIEKSPFDNTYSADIGKRVDDSAEIKFHINVDGVKFEQVLYNESKNFKVSQKQAIEIAGKNLQNSINNMKKNDGYGCEAIVKILKDYSGESNRYFWYIGVISADGKTAGILIDTQTGDVVSKKV